MVAQCCIALVLLARLGIIAEPSQYAVLNNNAIINCTFTGKGVEIFWKKNEKRIESDRKYDVSVMGFLKIRNANLNDAGNYTCFASNIGGSVNKTILFTVLSELKH